MPIDAPIINSSDILEQPDLVSTIDRSGPFEARLGKIALALGGKKIGINVTVVPPQSRAFPRHYHYVNDEAFYIIAGEGTLRYGEDRHPFKEGDVIYIRAGTGIPFQLLNTSDAELRYLALSSMIPADVFYYPDSDKHGIMANGTPFHAMPSDGLDRFAKWVEADHGVGYYHNDPDAT
ncbi:MAG: cupin domain-containing protein [Pseudomonadota bacterium]